jgi:hypothetical protein
VRVRVVITAGIFALIGSASAPAADLGGGAGPGYAGSARAVPLTYYDFEPGVEMRAYWVTPYRGLHYFPSSNEAPQLGRKESLGAAKSAPGETMVRDWSSFPVDVIPQPTLIAPPPVIVPREAPRQDPSLK